MVQDSARLRDLLGQAREARANGLPLPELQGEAWMARLRRSYTMQEQHALHHGGAAAGEAQAQEQDADITFF